MKSLIKILSFVLLIFLIFSCNRIDLRDRSDWLTYPSSYIHDPRDVPDPTSLPFCENTPAGTPASEICIVFHDSFERAHLLGNNEFNWNMAILDHGGDGQDIDAKIENSNHLGSIIDKDNAVIFSGRPGGSTHEIFLTSKPLNLSQYNKVYIQFHYVAIGLEDSIKLSNSQEVVPESIRIDICKGSDADCGLNGNYENLGYHNKEYWDQYWLEPMDTGRNNNIKKYSMEAWKKGQILVDLNNYDFRRSNFVFKVSVALDEGYINNNELEDGIILDNFYVVAIM